MNKDAYPWHLARNYFVDIGAFVFLIVFGIGSLMASIDCWHGKTDWFQRSGSITVLLSSFIEYRHFIYYRANPTHRSVLSGELSDIPFTTWLASLRNIIGKFSLFFLICGTFIWGYGDIPFEEMAAT